MWKDDPHIAAMEALADASRPLPAADVARLLNCDRHAQL
jgi:hypothetical protein